MDIRWLQDFLTVAELRNFTRAAAERNASQAAFSRRIQSLESWLGVTLIDRSVFPTRLTDEGERFRDHAAEILRQLVDARIDLSGGPVANRDQLRIALPHALATGRLPEWWAEWSGGRPMGCQVIPGNVHDAVTAFVSGEVDFLICFHHAQQPVHLDPEQYDRVVIGTEKLRPYATGNHADIDLWPGSPDHPVPVLMYSRGTYLGRMVDLILESAPKPLIANRVMESDMADVLRAMALAGYGIAWLPDCAADSACPALVPLPVGEGWTLTLSIIAYRDRANNRPAVKRLWAGLVSAEEGAMLSPSGGRVLR